MLGELRSYRRALVVVVDGHEFPGETGCLAVLDGQDALAYIEAPLESLDDGRAVDDDRLLDERVAVPVDDKVDAGNGRGQSPGTWLVDGDRVPCARGR